MNNPKRIVFLTGTRADYGKIKGLALKLSSESEYDVHLFVTGMHMLQKYGATAKAVMREFDNVYLFNNQPLSMRMDMVLSNTIYGFSHYVSELNPDMIVVHGDRPEALAGAIVGSFNNILVSHIEGGEVSGTIDGLIRHSVTKLSHIHFVANDTAQKRLIQLGEIESKIFSIGSPDIDVMLDSDLPSLEEVIDHYNISFRQFAIGIYHPVTTELEKSAQSASAYFEALKASQLNFILIYPNNDLGSESIIDHLRQLENDERFNVFPSVEFESFLTLLKSCRFIIGNSSAGIREAPVYRKWTINIGSRQQERSAINTIAHASDNRDEILKAIRFVSNNEPPSRDSEFEFGDGNSVERFTSILQEKSVWDTSVQKQFISR